MNNKMKGNDKDNQKRFKEAYSKALAQALLDNEKPISSSYSSSSPSSLSMEMDVEQIEQIEQTYKELCFDYTLAPKFESTSALALALLNSHCSNASSSVSSSSSGCSLALSNRFIQGVIDTSSSSSSSTTATAASASASNKNNTANAKQSNNDGNNNNNDDNDDYLESYESYLNQSLTSQSNTNKNTLNRNHTHAHTHTNSQGCNLLAFVVFALGPLQCIRHLQTLTSTSTSTSTSSKATITQVEYMKCINSIQSFLGSYTPNSNNNIETAATNTTTTETTETETKRNEEDKATDQLLASMNQMNITSNTTAAATTTSSTSTLTTNSIDTDTNMHNGKNKDDDDDDNIKNENDHNNSNNNNDMEEIWAEESDSDDYDYGNDRYSNDDDNNTNNNNNNNNNNNINDATTELFTSTLIDPKLLSKKQKRTFENMIQCIHSLLHELSYTKLSQLSLPFQKTTSTGGSTSASASTTTTTTSLWNEWNVTQTLYDLTFCLLQCCYYSSSSDNHNLLQGDMMGKGLGGAAGGAEGADMNTTKTLMTQHLSMFYMKPLMVLRDRALDEQYNSSSSSNNSAATTTTTSSMDDYIKLLHILLQSDDKIVGQYASQNKNTTDNNNIEMNDQKQLSPSRIIGLSSLATLCTSIGSSSSRSSSSSSSSNDANGNGNKLMKRVVHDKVRLAILDNIDELIDCIEFIRPKKMNGKQQVIVAPTSSSLSPSSPIPTWVRTTMSLLPILDFLTGINTRSDFSRIDETTITSSTRRLGLQNTDAQSILQSGLFRELLLLYSTTATTTASITLDQIEKKDTLGTAQEIIRIKLLRALLIISAQATSTLGKYAARVPDLIQILYSESFMSHHVVDSILWYSLFSHLHSAGGACATGSQLRMKGSVSLSASEMKDRCVQCTIQLCDNVINALQQESSNINNNETKNDKGDKGEETYLTDMDDFILFSNCLSQVYALAQFWVGALSDEMKKRVQESLSKVLRSLMENQKKHSMNVNDNIKPVIHQKVDDENDDDVDKVKLSKMKKNPSHRSVYSDKIRSSAKFLLLTIDNTNITQGGNFDTRGMSSKND